jgi:hypothetical protein
VATAATLAAAGVVLAAASGVAGAGLAGETPGGGGTSTSTASTTTTNPPTTTTTSRPTTTTTRPATTTTRPPSTTTTTRPASTTSTTLPRSTTTAQAPAATSTTAVPTTVPTTTTTSIAQLQVPGTGAVAEEAPDPGLSTETQLALVVGGLVGVGVTIAVLTILYWRHTRPVDVAPALDDLLAVVSVSGEPDGGRRTAVGPTVGPEEVPATTPGSGPGAGVVTSGRGISSAEVAPVDEAAAPESAEPIVTLEDLGLAGEPWPSGAPPSADGRT